MTTTRQPDFAAEIKFNFKGFHVTANATVDFAEYVAAPLRSEPGERGQWELTGLGLRDVSISYPLSDGSKGLHVELRSLREGDDNESADLLELGYLEGYASSRMPLDVFWTRFFEEASDAVKNALGTPRYTEAA